MKKITLTLPEPIIKWARVKAAHEDSSVSRIVGELLSQQIELEQDASLGDFIELEPAMLRSRNQPLPSREELHHR